MIATILKLCVTFNGDESKMVDPIIALRENCWWRIRFPTKRFSIIQYSLLTKT